MVRIKICGVTTPKMAAAMVELGADAVGLNFVPTSPRFVNVDLAREMTRELGPFCAPVGVFTDYAAVGSIPIQAGLRAVQTYDTGLLPSRFDPIAHILAIRISTRPDLEQMQPILDAVRPAAVLVDANVPGQLGGTGHQAPWELLAEWAFGVPLILAGGLTPDNVADAVRQVRPWGVDVASGVESAPGVKDASKVRDFLAAVRSVSSRPQPEFYNDPSTR